MNMKVIRRILAIILFAVGIFLSVLLVLQFIKYLSSDDGMATFIWIFFAIGVFWLGLILWGKEKNLVENSDFKYTSDAPEEWKAEEWE